MGVVKLNFTFSGSLQGWTGTRREGTTTQPHIVYDTVAGYPGVGCIRQDALDQTGVDPFDNYSALDLLVTVPSYDILDGADLSWFFRIQNRHTLERRFFIYMTGGPDIDVYPEIDVAAGALSDWVKVAGNHQGNDYGRTTVGFQIGTLNAGPGAALRYDGYYSIFVDNVFVDEFDPTPAPGGGTGTDFRFLNLAETNGKLYATAYDQGTLKLFSWAAPYTTRTEVTDFGTVTLADLDSGARKCTVLVVPGTQDNLIVYGLDGNGVIFQESIDAGATFTDLGDSGWSKVIIDAHPHPLDVSDIVAVFGDAIYRSRDKGQTWQQSNAVGIAATATARNLVNETQMLLANGSYVYTNNLGITVFDIGETAISNANQILNIVGDSGG